MIQLEKPPCGEITMKDLEEHLVSECGLSIRTEEEMRTAEKEQFLEQLPSHAAHVGGIDEDPTMDRQAWYEDEDYDRVLVCKAKNRPCATINLLRQCVRFNCRQVSGVFQSTGYYCMRVRQYYVEV